MDCARNKIIDIVEYMQKLGLDVNFNTQARGNQVFFLKKRIDISKKTPQNKILNVLLHEFAHFIHSEIEPNLYKTKGSLEIIFNTKDDIFEELVSVTNFIDENSKFTLLKEHRSKVKSKILEQEKIIKNYYPKFQRSKKFSEFNRFIRFSKAKYLLKYDRVKYITPILRRIEYYSIDNLERDFNLSPAFCAYIRLRSYQRKQARISAKINRLKKYYYSPTELFARFVEGYYENKTRLRELAPKSFAAFECGMQNGYYKSLPQVIAMASI